jgi:hypothetical protein
VLRGERHALGHRHAGRDGLRARIDRAPGDGERPRDGIDLDRRARRDGLGEERRGVDERPSRERGAERGREHVARDRAVHRGDQLGDARELRAAIPAERLDRGTRHPRRHAIRIRREDDRRRRAREDDGPGTVPPLPATWTRRAPDANVARCGVARTSAPTPWRAIAACTRAYRARSATPGAHGRRARKRGTVTSALTSSKTTSTGRPNARLSFDRFETSRMPGRVIERHDDERVGNVRRELGRNARCTTAWVKHGPASETAPHSCAKARHFQQTGAADGGTSCSRCSAGRGARAAGSPPRTAA